MIKLNLLKFYNQICKLDFYINKIKSYEIIFYILKILSINLKIGTLRLVINLLFINFKNNTLNTFYFLYSKLKNYLFNYFLKNIIFLIFNIILWFLYNTSIKYIFITNFLILFIWYFYCYKKSKKNFKEFLILILEKKVLHLRKLKNFITKKNV